MRVAWTIVGLGAVAVGTLLLAPNGTVAGSSLDGAEGVPSAPTSIPLLEASRRAELLGADAPPTTTTPAPALAPPTVATTAPAGPVLVPQPRSAPPLSAPELFEALYVGPMGRRGLDEVVVAAATGPPPPVPEGVAPLTGVAAAPELLARPAVVVKIDNSPRARPQAGLLEADLVYEELGEGGTSRFAAVLHSTDAAVGPVRSFRSTDIGLVTSLERPLLSWSGANAVFAELLRRQPVVDRGTSQAPYWRDRSRRAPHDLMTDTPSLRGDITGAGPPPHFVYRSPDDPVAGVEQERVDVRIGNQTISWRWNGVQWERWLGSSPHPSTVGPVLTTDIAVLQRAAYLPSGLVDGAGSVVPEAELLGTGTATILTAGRVQEATWTRPTLRSVTTFTDVEGEHVALTPGRTWVVLVDA